MIDMTMQGFHILAFLVRRSFVRILNNFSSPPALAPPPFILPRFINFSSAFVFPFIPIFFLNLTYASFLPCHVETEVCFLIVEQKGVSVVAKS
jgi:hypothetical protein